MYESISISYAVTLDQKVREHYKMKLNELYFIKAGTRKVEKYKRAWKTERVVSFVLRHSREGTIDATHLIIDHFFRTKNKAVVLF